MRNPTLLALVLLACASCDEAPTSGAVPTGASSLRVISTSPASPGTVALPPTWPTNARVLAPTVTIQFTYSESIAASTVVVDLMSGSNVCLEAEGLQMGAGYGTLAPYAGGSTITITGNNFERNMSYPLCGTTGFTTDHLRVRLLVSYPQSTPGGSRSVVALATEDVPLTWTFSK